MFNWYVFQSSIRLKANRLIYEMQYGFILNIKNIYDYVEIKIDIFIFDDEGETIRRFFVLLTVIAVLDKVLNYLNINLMTWPFENLMKAPYWKMIETTMQTTNFRFD